MSDKITARGTDAQFTPHAEGQYVGQCVDVIDLGQKVESFPGTPDKLAQKCALVFRTGERNEQTSEFIDIAREFTVSMGDLANLRKFLEQWRGKPYTPAQVADGVPIDKLTGQHGLLTVAHKTSGKGRTYANITACVGIPKQMASAVTDYTDYKRADYWADRKAEYAAGVAKFKAEQPHAPTEFEDYPDEEPSDDLPF